MLIGIILSGLMVKVCRHLATSLTPLTQVGSHTPNSNVNVSSHLVYTWGSQVI